MENFRNSGLQLYIFLHSMKKIMHGPALLHRDESHPLVKHGVCVTTHKLPVANIHLPLGNYLSPKLQCRLMVRGPRLGFTKGFLLNYGSGFFFFKNYWQSGSRNKIHQYVVYKIYIYICRSFKYD